MKRSIVALLPLLISACTTVQEIKRPDGNTDYIVACGASTGWNICYNKANEVCPAGYNTITEDGGFNRKELRIACPKPAS
jgi:hypothetical protein